MVSWQALGEISILVLLIRPNPEISRNSVDGDFVAHGRLSEVCPTVMK